MFFGIGSLKTQAPRSKKSADDLIDITYSLDEYREYFDAFAAAQRQRTWRSALDGLMRGEQWNDEFRNFSSI
jgi:hypothetical protein